MRSACFLLSIISALVFATPSHATIVNYGTLAYDTSTSIITGTDGYTFSSLSGAGLTYSQLQIEMADSSSPWYGYHVATLLDAATFMDQLLGGGSLCSGYFLTNGMCGYLNNWTDGVLGASFSDSMDYFTYATVIESIYFSVGLVGITATGDVSLYMGWGSERLADQYVTDLYPINYLLVKKHSVPSTVPEPSAIALMGLGLLGFGVSRRKQKKN